MSSEHCHTFLSRKITISVSICFIFFTFFLIILFKVFKAALKWRRRFAKIIWIFGLNLGLNRSTNTVTRFYRENSNVLVRNHFIFQVFLQQKETCWKTLFGLIFTQTRRDDGSNFLLKKFGIQSKLNRIRANSDLWTKIEKYEDFKAHFWNWLAKSFNIVPENLLS